MSHFALSDVSYHFLDSMSASANEDILSACAELYSNNYGIWSSESQNCGKRIKLSPAKISEWLGSANAAICYAVYNNCIIGYAIYFSIMEEDLGVVTWITQLVVCKEYRHRGISKNILLSIWGFSDHKAWGIVSANPYAIRALEKITRRRAVPERIKQDIDNIRKIGIDNVCFIDSDTEFSVDQNHSKVNTKFYVDHENMNEKISQVTKSGAKWILGDIEEGWEWCAFTFQDQAQIPLSSEELSQFVATSDNLVKEAYSRMVLDSTKQKWMAHEKAEIDYLKRRINFSDIKFAYDLGCGVGRHSILLAQDNIEVVGIDYISGNINEANRRKKEFKLSNLTFLNADIRHYRNHRKASLILCLYDVVGTFATKAENLEIIRTAYDLLSSGGYAVFSVMNYELTIARAVHTFKFSQTPNKLLELQPSSTMEKSGNVFLPEYYLVDEETHVVYRKEQFISSGQIPRELIVRDMRFTQSEINAMCREMGFEIIESRFVNASDWEKEYTATDTKAKEILVVCRKF